MTKLDKIIKFFTFFTAFLFIITTVLNHYGLQNLYVLSNRITIVSSIILIVTSSIGLVKYTRFKHKING